MPSLRITVSIGGRHVQSLQMLYKNCWNELKEYMRREVKPHNKDKLDGIAEFGRLWTRQSAKNISHLRKVLPKIIELEGAATGY